MATGYSRSPKLLKGALVEFSERFIGPIPNIIIFQYNPENLTRSMEVYNPFLAKEETDAAGKTSTIIEVSADAQPVDPVETFTLNLEIDATDDLEGGDPIAVVTGVADRLAALEMLLYPDEGGSLLGDLLASVSVSVGAGGISAGGSATAKADEVPKRKVPIVLFVWGPGRIVPVRLTSFQVEEQAFSPLLYPIQAKVSVGLRVLSLEEINAFKPDSIAKDIALATYKFTRKQKEVLAALNLANTVDSILGMLPF